LFVFCLYICVILCTDLDCRVMEVNGRRLQELREQSVLSMRELEERSGISYHTIWRLENGKTGAHPRTIRKLAEALGCEPSELLKGSDRGG
jgi:transcriptional regulator with XRE-family HTH domain